MAVAARSASVLKQDEQRNKAMYDLATRVLNISSSEFVQVITSVRDDLSEVLSLFGLSDRGSLERLAEVIALVESLDREAV